MEAHYSIHHRKMDTLKMKVGHVCTTTAIQKHVVCSITLQFGVLKNSPAQTTAQIKCSLCPTWGSGTRLSPCDGGNSWAHTTNHPASTHGNFTPTEMEFSSSTRHSLVCSLIRATLPISRALAAEYLNPFSLKHLFSYLPTLLEHGLGENPSILC